MTDPIAVSQAAREAAASTAEHDRKPSVANSIRSGNADQNWRVQAFARFEQATLEMAAGVAQGVMDTDGVRQYKSRAVSGEWVADKAADAIRALKGGDSQAQRTPSRRSTS